MRLLAEAIPPGTVPGQNQHDGIKAWHRGTELLAIRLGLLFGEAGNVGMPGVETDVFDRTGARSRRMVAMVDHALWRLGA